MSPFPGAWTMIKGERVKLLGSELVAGAGEAGVSMDDALTIACGDGAVRINRLQRAGKAAADTDDVLRGWPIAAGERMGDA